MSSGGDLYILKDEKSRASPNFPSMRIHEGEENKPSDFGIIPASGIFGFFDVSMLALGASGCQRITMPARISRR